MSAFKVGEIAIVQNSTGIAARYNGTECEVVQGLQMRKVSIGGVWPVYMIRLCDGSIRKAAEFHLKKKKPPSANSLVSWADCAWRPVGVTI